MDIRTQLTINQTVCDAGSEAGDNILHKNIVAAQGIAGLSILRILITETFTGLAEGLRVVVESDSENTFSTDLREEVSSPNLLIDRLVIGNIIDIPVPKGDPALEWQEFWRAYFVQHTNVATAGKMTVGLV
jgi:hypothetical protein